MQASRTNRSNPNSESLNAAGVTKQEAPRVDAAIDDDDGVADEVLVEARVDDEVALDAVPAEPRQHTRDQPHGFTGAGGVGIDTVSTTTLSPSQRT